MTTQTYSRNIGSNKGKPRLWLEGSVLADHGFSHGDKWLLVPTPSNGGFEIRRVETDEKKIDGLRVRKIAGSTSRPIIDVSGSSLGMAGNAQTVTVEAREIGLIAILPKFGV